MGHSTFKPLIVENVHLHEKENAEHHHTRSFELVTADPPTPVLRRGQPFEMTIRFDRPFDITTDIVHLSFSFGTHPNALRGTKAILTLPNETIDKVNSEDWSVRMIGSQPEDQSLRVEVFSPADSPVGVWKLEIGTALKGNRARNNYYFDRDIYLLFNPWVKDDLVYMEEQELLEEYVSNDFGKVWMSAPGGATGKKWIFGQFDACVLPACELMLGKAGIRSVCRGDPIRVSRAISKIVNSNDDAGVLAGKWFGDYSGGTHPSAWTGSVPILEQFLETGTSVNYGQCWVFAAVVNTVCRALGLPSRVVTNLFSAHDSNGSLSIDNYYDADFNRTTGPCSRPDSVWNFHVWNDVWMARPDLPKGYGGWQAIDATPQEESDGSYQCGPTSVEAVRQGLVGYNYDAPFVISTVNADVIDWMKDKESDIGWREIARNESHVGRMLLTKKPFTFDPYGDRDVENIIGQYKNSEGSEEERFALRRAARDLRGARRNYHVPSPDEETVKFELVPLDIIQMGDSFTVTVNIENKSNSRQTVKVLLYAESIYYNGVKGHLVKSTTATCYLPPGEREVLRLTVTADNYMDKLVDYSLMKMRAAATVCETKQTWASEDDFQIAKPEIAMKVENRLVIGKPAVVSLSFKNPLKKTLTECKFNIAGFKSIKNETVPFKNAAPGETVHVKHMLVPQKLGDQEIIATFTSNQLINITGSTHIEVLKEE